MKKILVVDREGNFGHAEEKSSGYKGITYLEVRMFKDYDKVHTMNRGSFLIYYEVCDEQH